MWNFQGQGLNPRHRRWPESQQWQSWILNPLSHQGTPIKHNILKKGIKGFIKLGLLILPLQVVIPNPCPYLDRLWGSYELLLDLLLLDVLMLITWGTIILWIRTGYIKNLDIYLPIKEKTQWNPEAIFISFSYQKYTGIFFLFFFFF